MDQYAEKALRDIRFQLNYYRRAERALLKRIQEHCPHHRVQRVYKQPAPLTLLTPTTSIDAQYWVYHVCVECGKRL